MQMIKNNKKNKGFLKKESGVTLILLIIMILVLNILAVVTIMVGSTSADEVLKRQELATLNMVQELVIGQYSKALFLGETNRPLTDTQPSSYFGRCLKTYGGTNGFEYIHEPDYEEGETPVFEEAATYYSKLHSSSATYDDCYYRLSGQDLMNLGIYDSTDNNDTVHTYVVKYSTGEVYDETERTTEFYVEGNKKIKTIVDDSRENKVKTEIENFVD